MDIADNGEKISPIYIVSGGKGLAGDAVVQSVLIQFPNNKIPVIIVPDILNQQKIDEVISKALETDGVIVHTMVDPDARKMLIDSCAQRGVNHFDLVGDLSDYLSNLLNTKPISKPGLYRLSNIAYFQRVEAIDFTLKVDDGQNPERITQADIVLTGVSRTGKTPLSVYLAMFGWKVANVPLVPGIEPPGELFKADPRRVFGLNISSIYLISQRANRVKSLHMDIDTDYINTKKVGEELTYARRIFEKGGFTEIQITNKPIESSANEILNILTSRFDQEKWKKGEE
jgi:[pyruvate, water dikinase]-phosphate phosphotransferase / [pyruvate, water dikinase] kinase